MGTEKTLFQKDCECRYVPKMNAEVNYEENIRTHLVPGFMDRVVTTGDISKTDFFYLRAVVFFRVCSAEMVAEFLSYFRNYYGSVECSELLQPAISSKSIDPITYEENWRNDVAECRNRLTRLAKKFMIFSLQVTKEHDEKEYVDTLFCSNAVSFSIVRTVFGDTPFFGIDYLLYEKYYCLTPIQKCMETMHACRVGILAFMNHGKRALLTREKEIVYGARKEILNPAMIAEISCGEYTYKVVLESIHFTYDNRLLTETEHENNIKTLIKKMGNLVSHYQYQERTFQTKPLKERIRFLIAVENVEGMKKIIKLMEPAKEKFDSKVFFTSDTFLKGTDSLQDCIFMAKELEKEDTKEKYLGLVRPKERTLRMQNEWVFEELPQ